MYQNLELHLDAAIDKVDNLAKDVELQRMEKKWDELYEQTHQEGKETAQPQAIALVSEKMSEGGLLRRIRHLPVLMVSVRGCEWRMNSWQTVFVFLPERSRWIIQRRNMHSEM